VVGTSLVQQLAPSSSTLRYHVRRTHRFQSRALLLRYMTEEGSLVYGRNPCLASDIVHLAGGIVVTLILYPWVKA
jgi:hypothetical protein